MEEIKTEKTDSSVIWYLHHYAGSPSLGMSFRPYYLSQEFNKNGYKTYIIGSSFHHLMQAEIKQDEPVNHQVYDSQDYIFLKTSRYVGNGIKRFINMFAYSWRVWRHQKALIKITGAPSNIIVSSAHLFHYFSALRIAKKYGAKIILEVRDLWPESLIELLNISPKHPMVLLIKWIEKSAYKNSNYIVSLLSNALPYMSKYGVTPERFVYISNGISTNEALEDKRPIPENYTKLIEEQRKKGVFLFGYTGAHGVPNALDDLLNALILLKNSSSDALKVHFFLVGAGNKKDELQEIAKINKLSSVTFLDPLHKNQVIPFLELMDAAYLGWKKRPLYNYGISPNKLFDYMLAAKPILHAFSASSNNVVSTFELGLTVAAEDANQIALGIQQMINKTNQELLLMGNRGKSLVLSDFSYTNLGKKYIELFSIK